MPTIQHLMHLQGSSHMNSCLSARHQWPCDNWLGLGNYQSDSFKSKTVWLNQQLNAMMHANKQALKLNQQVHFTQKITYQQQGSYNPNRKSHPVACDHPEGRNKIQNRFKSDIYVMVNHHKELNVYYIQLVELRQGSVLQRWWIDVNYMTYKDLLLLLCYLLL